MDMVNRSLRYMAALFRCERGATSIEYAMLAGAIAAGICILMLMINPADQISHVASLANSIVPAGGEGGSAGTPIRP